MSLNGKVALVTGGAQGIGRAICDALLKKGAKVCVVDVSERDGKKCLEELGKIHGGDKLLFAPCDVSKTEQLEAAFQKTKSAFGRIDIVGNNAGIWNSSMSRSYERILDINLKAVIAGTVLSMKYLGKNSGGNGGVVINTSSMSGLLLLPFNPVYGATKAGVVFFSRNAALQSEMVNEGIRVNCICPSFVETPMLRKLLKRNTDERKEFVNTVGVVEPELVAEGFIRLVEDETKNGAVMRVTQQKGIDYQKFAEDRLRKKSNL